MNAEFWRGKRVFVTGHTGFKGGWLSLWLQQLGAEVVGYALTPPTTPSLFEVAQVGNGMMSIEGDVRDLVSLQDEIATHKPEIIFHMAAQPLVRYSYANPVETYATNVMGTVHLLEAVRQTDETRVVVNITSDKCYENREWVWGYRENEAMGGHDPYSNSKGCAELVASAYRNSFFNQATYHEHGVGLASVRAGNVIGGGDWAGDRLIPDIIRAIIAGESVLIRSPNAIRPWQHVLEPLGGYMTLAEQMWDSGTNLAEGWNFGPNDSDARPVSWITEQLTQLWGDGASWQLDTKVNPHEATYLKLDCSKAKSRLKWSPKLDLATTLDWIVEWYRSYIREDDMHQMTVAQIQRYESRQMM
ncbi:CDP-glucose 4,6-dehydratase [Leptolyngbya cf. ectocarpi LEGE 11479]|uniref:CDP-glucose 4,6-dehydratase n=1 Tax=Leptolyngbya cf. ectocarpi LEGE 11479 TaxID=1828722 RepID=A0A928X3G0_LEPEC|nr:CDP-glucose 4,6-dehydratase [Leptolyngbya ectocarpi]MBE9065843.1 CDP-glucose 4,6-dehydratase [Leptolyngbya cf. ectocarpi LEGE 11479]